MRKILLVALVFISANCFAQKTIIVHGDTLWLKNFANGDSSQINKTGLFALKTDVKDSLDIVRTALSTKLSASGSAASLTNFPTLNQNTSGTAAGLSSVLTFDKGGITGVTAMSATTGTISVPMTSRIITVTPTGAITANATGGVAGQMVTFSITTSGVSSFVITFGTNFRKTATLATGTTSARFFTVTFICIDGTIWSEVCRTAVQS